MELPSQSRTELKEPAVRAYLVLASRWQLSLEQQWRLLGLESPEQWHRCVEDPEHLPAPAMAAISYLLGLYAALHEIFEDAGEADAWVRKEIGESPFDGVHALAYLMRGQAEREILQAWLQSRTPRRR